MLTINREVSSIPGTARPWLVSKAFLVQDEYFDTVPGKFPDEIQTVQTGQFGGSFLL